MIRTKRISSSLDQRGFILPTYIYIYYIHTYVCSFELLVSLITSILHFTTRHDIMLLVLRPPIPCFSDATEFAVCHRVKGLVAID